MKTKFPKRLVVMANHEDEEKYFISFEEGEEIVAEHGAPIAVYELAQTGTFSVEKSLKNLKAARK